MPFDPIGGLVATKSFTLNFGITGIFNRLRINNNQGCPLSFFLPAHEYLHAESPWCLPSRHCHAIVCNAKTRLSRAASLWVSRTNCSHSSGDRRPRQGCLSYSTLTDRFSFSLATAAQSIPTRDHSNYWNMASLSQFHLLSRYQMGSIKLAGNWICCPGRFLALMDGSP